MVKEIKVDGFLNDKVICFTGFRDSNLVNKISENGGKYIETMNSTVNLLVYNENSSAKSKLEKAEKKGILTITRKDFDKQFTKDDNNTSFNSLF